jgi:hypothetical protein
MMQIELHKKIDELLLGNPANTKREDAVVLLSQNSDSKQYFFAKADERWLDWFWSNGLLDEIKKPADDTTQYRFATPEITYLTKVTEIVPEKVIQIMLDPETATTKEKFRPELIDQFLRISGNLKADQLKLIIPKIHDQNWIKTMRNFNHWGFEYEKIFKTLVSAGDFDSLLLLAQTILVVHTKEEMAKTSDEYSTDNPFYFKDIDQTGIFGFLTKIPDSHLEQALSMTTKIMGQIVSLGEEDKDPKRVFHLNELFYLFDVDFFTIDVGQKDYISYRDNVRELAAVIKVLITRLLEVKNDKHDEVKRIYDTYIDSLPESRAMWRLRLYSLSLCPEILKDKLKSAYFRLFDVENYYEITGGSEYEKTIQKGFGVLDNNEQREYINKLFSYFNEHKINGDENCKRKGSRILSVIYIYLTEKEKEEAVSLGFTLIPDYKPEPSIVRSMSGTIVSQGPISQEDFNKLSPEEISNNLKGIWSPQALRDKYKGTDNFLSPHNAEGAGDLLKEALSKNLQNFVNNANKFFERNILDAHYTYSFLRGIEDIFRKNKNIINGVNWDGLINLLVDIKTSGKSKQFEQDKEERSFDAWLAGWTSVHNAMTDVVQQLLIEDDGKTPIDFAKHRDNILEIIKYLLNYPDPTPKKESLEDPIISTNYGGQRLVSDPHSIAINTVRGRAFQALVYFIYPDGRELPDGSKIKEDTKALYEEVLTKEDTRALMFMFGHYLPQFYFREIAWMQKMIPQIFPEDPAKSHLYLAAWEGYLSSNLYKQIFEDPNIQPLYYRGIDISKIKETNRQYSRDPEEGLANHIALAYIHYNNEFNFNNLLFKEFWDKGTLVEHGHFIDFLGRSYITGGNLEMDRFMSENESAKENLKKMWEWVIDNRTEPEIFEKFGFWVNVHKDLFPIDWLADKIKRSLEKSNGKFERDYELTKSIVTLSQKTPKDALKIAELVLLVDGVRGNNQRRMFYIEGEWIEALKNLYQNSITKQETYRLIDDLIREGGSTFWGLKEIIN